MWLAGRYADKLYNGHEVDISVHGSTPTGCVAR
jgi:hypothetical protein